ncbi:MAG TPA: hypothetical protein VNW29_08030 [Candidatus Sulfotelmatobacter sp.]|jgi:hypothetical protein|nr:hypothetical protein [Candidatus Sulfotelmatobacter sp.]
MDHPNTDKLEELARTANTSQIPPLIQFILTCLFGFVPPEYAPLTGIGSAVTNAAIQATTSDGGKQQEEFNNAILNWIRLQADEIKEIVQTIREVIARLDLTDEKIRERLKSPEYLKLLKKALRDWSAAESEEKRRLIRNLLTNAASTTICSDDVVSLFIKWIDDYSEGHFRVIGALFNHAGYTRYDIWINTHPNQELPREDSAEADLYKRIIHDLSVGHVIRQHRERDYAGNFLPKPKNRNSGRSGIITSAFDRDDGYELTALGEQFVSYTMNEVIPKLSEEVK